MSPSPEPPRNDALLRFRLRSLMTVTTVVAVLAAIAGPYYRRQSSDAQTSLAMYWSCVLAFTAIGLLHHCRTTWRVPEAIGAVRFVLPSESTRKSRWWRKPAGLILMLAMWVIFFAVQSNVIVFRVDRGGVGSWGWYVVTQGCFHGLITGGWLVAFVQRPTYLGENGVWRAPAWGPWRYIRHAAWDVARPGVMKFRRLDGDIYVATPERLRGEIEAFVRTKTTLLELALGDSPGEPDAD